MPGLQDQVQYVRGVGPRLAEMLCAKTGRVSALEIREYFILDFSNWKE